MNDDYKKRHRINDIKDCPTGAHLALLEFYSVYHEGDERSRTNPGHGYPAYTESVVRYTWWLPEDRHLWLKEIQNLMAPTYGSRKNFLAMENGIPVTPKIKIEVEI